MRKYISDFIVTENMTLSHSYALLKLKPTNGETLPQIKPGQFVEIKITGSENTFLRRPISICNIDSNKNEIWLLIRNAGEGTKTLIDSQIGSMFNMMIPLGNSFSFPKEKSDKVLLVGGGVGVAPLLYFGKVLSEKGYNPVFLLAAKTKSDLLLVDKFSEIAPVLISTDDGSYGEKGIVTHNSVFNNLDNFTNIFCCGPLPMMKGIAKIASDNGVECEVSLENLMACGIGACLCCVEDTTDGNVCVCKEGPIFNIKKLKW